MALKLFLSHASKDKPIVEEVKRLLEDGGECECWLDSYEIGYGDNIASRIQEGVEWCDALLAFFSGAARDSKWVKEEWTAVYWRQVNAGKVQVIPVLLGDGEPPALLANKKYCDLQTNWLDGVARLKTDLLRGRARAETGRTAAAGLPNFIGRERELAELRQRLSLPGAFVPVIGMPGLGKTYLAREFVRQHGAMFEAVYELDCQTQDLAALAGKLAGLLGLRLEGQIDEVCAELRGFLAGKRCLLLLDNVDDDQPAALVPGGRASVLVTARDGTIPFIAEHPEVTPALFTDEEAMNLFRRILVTFAEDAAKKLFLKLGHLPIAISVAAGLIKHDVRYTVESLAGLADLKHGTRNVELLLAKAIAALGADEGRLLRAMAACAPAGVRLGFAAELAELPEGAALEALQGIFKRSLVVELDRGARRYRLHPLIREAAVPANGVRARHAELVDKHLDGWNKAPLEHAAFLEEAAEAVRAAGDSYTEMVCGVALDAGNLARALGQLTQAYEFQQRVDLVATQAGNDDWLRLALGNQAVILMAWGRLEEATELLQKEEAICIGLGDRAGTGRSYGNQAVILMEWGRLEDAMALLQKQEAICNDLGNRALLGVSYGNQAVILKAWGRLEEAMALHQKEAAICNDLGDRAGLQASYGNQALILKSWGRLEEAMALHQKEEAICNILGDMAGLGRSYGNQALILMDRGRLEEAMALHQKEEAICNHLGDRGGLGCCYANWGLLERKQGLDGSAKLRAALEIFTELKMPLAMDEVREALGEQSEG